MSPFDRVTDPRSWSPLRRASHLKELGLPLTVFPSDHELSTYKGVTIFWSSTLDDRITILIDRVVAVYTHLIAASAHKGTCELEWNGEPPEEYAEGRTVEVAFGSEGHEAVDTWTIVLSRDAFPSSVPLDQALTYPDYLETEHWRAKRREAIAHYGPTCVLCGSYDRVQVHHRSYENLGDEPLTDLIVLCRKCHAKHHDKPE